MADIPLNEIIRQVRLQWQMDDARAGMAVEEAMVRAGIEPRKKLFGGKVISAQEYHLLLDWMNQNGLR